MWNELEDVILREIEADCVAGLCIALVREGETVHEASYGSADLERGVPMTPEVSFDAASITKALVATALMPFARAGSLDLDAPVEAYLEGIRFENPFPEPVTTRQLLTHTAGLPVGNAPADPAATTLRACVQAGARVTQAPGARIVYANWGYDTLGYLLGLLAGRPWHEHVQEAWLEPLGMTHSRIGARPEARGHYVSAVDGLTRPLDRPENAIDPPTPAGSLVSTVGDLARFLALHLRGGRSGERRFLDAETVDEMHRVHVERGRGAGMGLGFRVDRFEGATRIGHGGDGLGTTNWIAALPERGVGFALLMNLSGAQSARSQIGTAALRLLMDARSAAPPRAPSAARPKPGRYRSGFWDIEIDVDSDAQGARCRVVDGLVMGLQRAESRLTPLGDGAFLGAGGWFDGFTLQLEGDTLHGGLYPYSFERIGETPGLDAVDDDAILTGYWRGECASPLGPLALEITVRPGPTATLSILTADGAPIDALCAAEGRLEGESAVEVAGFGAVTLFVRLEARGGGLVGRLHARGSFGEIGMPTELGGA